MKKIGYDVRGVSGKRFAARVLGRIKSLLDLSDISKKCKKYVTFSELALIAVDEAMIMEFYEQQHRSEYFDQRGFSIIFVGERDDQAMTALR